MLLGIEAFRKIKPVGCTDDYLAGCAVIDEQGMTRKQVSELFTDRIVNILGGPSRLCTKQVTLLSGVSHAATAKKLRTLSAKGIIDSIQKRVGKNTKPTNFYSLVKVA